MSDTLLKQDVRAALERAAGRPGAVDVPLASLTTIGCGGPAAFVIEAESALGLSSILEVAEQHSVPWCVLGFGSNLLVADEGWEGLIIRLVGGLKLCEARRSLLDCGGGAALPQVARTAANHGLAGLEGLAGIPGSIGGAVAMNAGAFGQTIGDLVREVELCLPGEIRVLHRPQLDFEYRSANLPAGSVVSRAMLHLTEKDPDEIDAAQRAFRDRRKATQPWGQRTFGSVFRNPETSDLSAGQLLDQAGCKDLAAGDARVSTLHANFIVNDGGATTTDVVSLMEACRQRVFDRFGVVLEPEVKMLGDISLEPVV